MKNEPFPLAAGLPAAAFDVGLAGAATFLAGAGRLGAYKNID